MIDGYYLCQPDLGSQLCINQYHIRGAAYLNTVTSIVKGGPIGPVHSSAELV